MSRLFNCAAAISAIIFSFASAANDSDLLNTAQNSGQAQDWVNYLQQCSDCNERAQALGALQALQLDAQGKLQVDGVGSIQGGAAGGLKKSTHEINTGSEQALLALAKEKGQAIDWYSYLASCQSCEERQTALNALQQLQYASNGNAFKTDLAWTPGSTLPDPNAPPAAETGNLPQSLSVATLDVDADGNTQLTPAETEALDDADATPLETTVETAIEEAIDNSDAEIGDTEIDDPETSGENSGLLSGAIASAIDGANAVAETVSDTSSEVIESVKETTAEWVDEGTAMAADAKDSLLDAGEAAVDAVSDAADQVTESVDSLLNGDQGDQAETDLNSEVSQPDQDAAEDLTNNNETTAAQTTSESTLAIKASSGADKDLLDKALDSNNAQDWVGYLTDCSDCNNRNVALGQLQALQLQASGKLQVEGVGTLSGHSGSSLKQAAHTPNPGSEAELLAAAKTNGSALDWYSYLVSCSECDERQTALGALQSLQMSSQGKAFESNATWTPAAASTGLTAIASAGDADNQPETQTTADPEVEQAVESVGETEIDTEIGTEIDTDIEQIADAQEAAEEISESSSLENVQTAAEELISDASDSLESVVDDAEEWVEDSSEAVADTFTADDPEAEPAETSSQEDYAAASSPAEEAIGASSIEAEAEYAEDSEPAEVPSELALANRWDAPEGNRWELATEISGHSRGVRRVDFSPSADIFASGSSDKTVRIYDLKKHDTLHVLKGHSAYVNAVAFSPNGNKLASGAGDRTIIIWNANNGSKLNTLKGHKGDINSIAWSPSGEMLVSAADDGLAIVWDVNGDKITELDNEGSDVTAVAVSADETQIATGGNDGFVRLYNSQTGALEKKTFSHTGYTFGLAWNSNGKELAMAGSDGAVRIWQTASEDIAKVVDSRRSGRTSVAYSGNGKYLAASGFDGSVVILNAKTHKRIQTISAYNSNAYSATLSHDGRWLAAAGGVSFVRLWRR